MLASVRLLAIDRQTVAVLQALSAADVDALLIKGPVAAQLLYRRGEFRGYVDTDVLVSPSEFDLAGEILEGLGFDRVVPSPGAGREWRGHADTLIRPGAPVAVDLHWTFHSVGDRDRVFEVAWRDRRMITVAEEQVAACSEAFATLLVALHVAGTTEARPLEDLRRAVDRLPFDLWKAAAEHARELSADGAMRLGMQNVRGGEELAALLGLPTHVDDVSVRLRAAGEGRPALTIARMAAEPTLIRRARAAARKLFPSPAYVRWFDREILGVSGGSLVGAYARRLPRVLGDARPAWRAYRVAKAESRHC